MGNFDSELMREMTAAQIEFNEATRRQLNWTAEHGPPPPLSRRERVRWAVRDKVRDSRQRVALKIAPWLDEY